MVSNYQTILRCKNCKQPIDVFYGVNSGIDLIKHIRKIKHKWVVVDKSIKDCEQPELEVKR